MIQLKLAHFFLGFFLQWTLSPPPSPLQTSLCLQNWREKSECAVRISFYPAAGWWRAASRDRTEGKTSLETNMRLLLLPRDYLPPPPPPHFLAETERALAGRGWQVPPPHLLYSCQPLAISLNSCQPLAISLYNCQPLAISFNSFRQLGISLQSCQLLAISLYSCQPLAISLYSCQPLATAGNQSL